MANQIVFDNVNYKPTLNANNEVIFEGQPLQAFAFNILFTTRAIQAFITSNPQVLSKNANLLTMSEKLHQMNREISIVEGNSKAKKALLKIVKQTHDLLVPAKADDVPPPPLLQRYKT